MERDVMNRGDEFKDSADAGACQSFEFRKGSHRLELWLVRAEGRHDCDV